MWKRRPKIAAREQDLEVAQRRRSVEGRKRDICLRGRKMVARVWRRRGIDARVFDHQKFWKRVRVLGDRSENGSGKEHRKEEGMNRSTRIWRLRRIGASRRQRRSQSEGELERERGIFGWKKAKEEKSG